MAELAKMYPPQANTPETSLSGALTAAGTTVNVVDGTMLPDAPNLLTIGADGSTAETVLMTEKNGNVLTVVRGQDGTTARAWSAGDVIGRYFTAADQKAMQDNITALNNGKGHIPDGWQPRRVRRHDRQAEGQRQKAGRFRRCQPHAQRVRRKGFVPGFRQPRRVRRHDRQAEGQRQKAGRFRRCQPFTQRICAGAYFPECQRCSVRVEKRQHVCSVPVRGDTDADGRDRKPRAGGHVRGNGSRIRHLRARRAVRQRYGQNLRRVETGGGDHAAIYFVH